MSALIHAATMGWQSIFSRKMSPIFEYSRPCLTLVAIIEIAVFFAASVAIVQNDIKIIAYLHAAIVICFCGWSWSYHVAIFHLFTRFFQSNIIFRSGSVIHSLKDEQEIERWEEYGERCLTWIQ